MHRTMASTRIRDKYFFMVFSPFYDDIIMIYLIFFIIKIILRIE